MSAADSLALLRDFDHWFTQLPLRLPGVSRQQLEPLRERARQSLSLVARVRSFELSELRDITRPQRAPGEFLVTLDGGTYFAENDLSFAMTRAVTRLPDAVRGQMIRVARQGHGQFWTQVMGLRRAFEQSGATAIVLCDDGIDTGHSLAEVVRQLKGQYLSASRIEVLLNPHRVPEIEGVPVKTLLPDAPLPWTHERDLFWGAPGGGVSLISDKNINEVSGIPYSIACELLRRRLELQTADLQQLRRELLLVNMDFWDLLSRAAGRELRLRDSKRLSWGVQLDPSFTDKTPITAVIEWLIDHEPHF